MFNAAIVKSFLPQFHAMVAELETRPNVPRDVIETAKAFIASLERWVNGVTL